MACLGLIVLVGCLALLTIPQPETPRTGRMRGPQNKPIPLPGFLPTIVIDPGHGGEDEGTKGFGLKEKELSLDVAFRLERLLQGHYFQTVLTRRSDVFMSLADRVALANRQEHALFVSIHFNESKEGLASGAETFFADQKPSPAVLWNWETMVGRDSPPPPDTGEGLAASVQEAMAAGLPVVNRGSKSGNLYVIRNVRCPGVLVEAGFVSNPLDAERLKDADYREKLAEAIAEGILNYEKSSEIKTQAVHLVKAKN